MFMVQMHGFTCGVDDLLIVKDKERERKNHLHGSEEIGKRVHLEALELEDGAEIGMFSFKTFETYIVCSSSNIILFLLFLRIVIKEGNGLKYLNQFGASANIRVIRRSSRSS